MQKWAFANPACWIYKKKDSCIYLYTFKGKGSGFTGTERLHIHKYYIYTEFIIPREFIWNMQFTKQQQQQEKSGPTG